MQPMRVFSIVMVSALLYFFSNVDIVLADEQVTFYPTYGYQKEDHWVVPMRTWVHERRPRVEKLIKKVVAEIGDTESNEMELFRLRTQDFLADDKSDEVVTFIFDNDPERQKYRVQDHDGEFLKTDRNGLVEGVILLSIEKANELLRLQQSSDGWLTYRAVSRGHSGVGRVRLITPTGLSVISDIDDTVKITEIPAGSTVVIKNTFFREFVASPGMATMYQQWQSEGAVFHYVSGGPWQLYRPLSEFLFSEKEGFPEGTFHMKSVTKNFSEVRTWKDLGEFVTNENATFDQKIRQISEILERFPERKFILVGDSGEKDPEVYSTIRRKFGQQVQEIWIRDVINRFDGMKIISATAVAEGISQFGSEERVRK